MATLETQEQLVRLGEKARRKFSSKGAGSGCICERRVCERKREQKTDCYFKKQQLNNHIFLYQIKKWLPEQNILTESRKKTTQYSSY